MMFSTPTFQPFRTLMFIAFTGTIINAGLAVVPVATAQQELPRILIIGDSVYREPARQVTKELKGRFEVVFPAIEPGEFRNTKNALIKMEEWLGTGNWDLIHFNFGLGDLVHVVPGLQTDRVLAINSGGVRATNPETYENNLNQIVSKLKATNAKLVWATTTPIRSTPKGIFEAGSEVIYNDIANKVMARHKIRINDMYEHVRGLIDMNRPAPHGADPFQFDKKPIHQPIVDAIIAELEKSPG